jgi:hypothetical protein
MAVLSPFLSGDSTEVCIQSHRRASGRLRLLPRMGHVTACCPVSNQIFIDSSRLLLLLTSSTVCRRLVAEDGGLNFTITLQ